MLKALRQRCYLDVRGVSKTVLVKRLNPGRNVGGGGGKAVLVKRLNPGGNVRYCSQVLVIGRRV